MKYLTFALTKGRLASKTLEMLEQLGITCEEMKEKDSRKLVFVNEELKLKFFLAKGPDVPTYVEYGAADIGVVGKDTIVEKGRNVHEVLDLGFGSCRMCVCGPQDAKELLEHREVIRVATKYPKIAKDYFSFYDLGKTEYFASVCPGVDWEKTGIVVVHIEADFVKQIFASDHIAVQTAVSEVGTKSFHLLQRVIDTKTNEIKCICKSIMVTFDLERHESMPLTEEWIEAICKYEGRDLRKKK